MFYDYRTNVSLYSKWQKQFRKSAPPTIILWEKNDNIFPESGVHPYKKDIKDIEVHILNTGHFALEEKGVFMSKKIINFLDRKVK
jgi:pimeloyl-ACP methyl ester carboxylesterase